MSKSTKKTAATVRPSERAPGKFEGVYPDGTAHPYAFRTEAEALAAVSGGTQTDDAGDDAPTKE